MPDDPHRPTEAIVPTALVECPHCGRAIAVSVRDRPPIALPVSLGTLPLKPPNHCPHCGSRIWVTLRARAPIALPADKLHTALIPNPRSKPVDRRAATQPIITTPPPP